MSKHPILSKSISSLLLAGALCAMRAPAAAVTWDAGAGDTNLSNPLNWSGDILPSVAGGDTAEWAGTVAGPLALLYPDASFAGVAGNLGLNLSLTAAQTDALNIDSGANVSSFRMNNLTIAAGAGAFSLGDGAGVFNITLGGAGGQTHTWINDSASAVTVAADVLFGLGGGGAHTLALGGAGNWVFNTAIGQGTGVLTVTKNGAGSLTLTGANAYTGGLVLNAGTLHFNHASAIGNTAAGALVINGGTLDNTSGAAIITATAKPQNWNSDFTFVGTHNLNFNGGAVIFGGAGNTRTVDVNAGTLTVGNLVGVGYGFTKTGAGTLALGSGVQSRITGVLNVAGGTLQMAPGPTAATTHDLFVGGLTGSGTIEAGGGNARWLFVHNNADNLFSGTLRDGAGAGHLGLVKAGTGTLTLTGTNTYSHQTTVGGGTLEFGSATIPGITQTLSADAGTGLVFDRGDSAVKSSFNGTGTASLTFGARVARTAGATGNFIISGGTNGVDNRIILAQGPGFINQGMFFNGDNFAWIDEADSRVRAINYATDFGAATSGTAVSLAAGIHQEFTGDVTAQASAFFTSLKNSGNHSFVLDTGAVVTVDGILKTGNVAGGAVIAGGTGIQSGSPEMVVRVNGANDLLTIATPILSNGTNGLTTSGAGTVNLTATNTYPGTTTINNPLVNLSGSLASGAVNVSGGSMLNVTGSINLDNVPGGQIFVGWSSGGNAVLNIDGGTIRASRTASPSFAVGAAANSNGFVKMTSGTLTTVNQLNVGNGGGPAGSNAYGAFTLSGGSVTSGNWLVVGANNDRAILNQSGGSIAVTANRMTIGAGGNGSVGIVNQSGGTLSVAANTNTGIFLGENGYGVYTLSGDAALTLATNGSGASGTMQFAGNASALGGNFNLNGGTLTTFGVTKGASTAGAVYRFNFNGGTLRANASNGGFFGDLANTEAYVQPGGALIDTNGNAVTIAEPLRAPIGSGLNGIEVANAGAGYIDQPVVTISGGSGTGATAIANVSGGVVTGFTITSPGSGYAPGDVLRVALFGGGASTRASAGTITFAPSASGGLVKNGTGTLTLNGANSFTGNITVNAGTLAANNSTIGNPVTSALGNNTVAGRTITVVPNATLNLTINDVFGNGLAAPANLPTLTIRGTLNTTRYNQIGALRLEGGTLASTNVTDQGNYQNFQFLSAVQVAGSAPSFISAAGAANFDSNHLSTLTTFDVGDVTGNGNADLIVSAPFRNQSGNYGLGAGSLAKAGTGTMTLSGASTYTGSTAINAGTLQLTGAGEINATSGILVDGPGARFVQSSTVAVTPMVTLINGSVAGTGTINQVAVADLASNTIGNGNGTIGGTLTVGALTFAGAGRISLLSESLAAPLAVTTLTTGAGVITIDATNANWTNGLTYDLISYGGGSILGGGFAAFNKGTITGLGARQSAILGNNGATITLQVAGDLPLWTGAASTAWTTAAIPGAKNWRLQVDGTPTDFLTGDTVVFDDSATNPTVSISGANVNPTSTTFENSTKTYTVTGTGVGIATGNLTKGGTGTLNLGGAHTYTGATLISAGTVNLTGSLGNTAVAVASGATLMLQAANAISQNTVTVNGTLGQTVDNALSGTAAIVLNSGATLGRANAHSGGTTLNDGTLNINHPNALGTGTFTIRGGTINNTSGAAVALTTSNAQTWGNAASLIFTGTNALDLGNGPVTLGTDGSAGAFTILNNSALAGTSLTVGGTIAPGGGGAPGLKTLIVDGPGETVLSGNFSTGNAGVSIVSQTPGVLTLSGAASLITTLNLNGGSGSTVELGAGNLTVSNGGGNIVQSTTGGALNATAGGSLVIGSANGDFGTAGGTTLTVNAKIAGNNSVDFWNANGGTGMGTIVLAGANTHTGAMNVQNTRIIVPAGGAINAPATPGAGQITVADTNAAPAVLRVDGGTINATKAAAPSILISSVAGSTGAMELTGGTVNATSEIWLANVANGYGSFTMSGGTVSTGNWLAVGRSGNGILNVHGGTLAVTGQNFTLGSFTGAFGVTNLTAGTVNVTSTAANQGGFLVAEGGNGILNVSGTAQLNISGARGLHIGVNGGTGVANLNGGTVTTPLVQKGTSAGTLTFDGGTLKASASSDIFMQGLTAAYVNDGGAVIDDGGHFIGIGQPLLAPTGNGVGVINVNGGTGYIGSPLVQINGDGTGATAVANIDAAGNLTGIVVTNPGVNYTSATVSLIGGGGIGAVVDPASLAPNVSGGLTKKGFGIVTLSAANTYKGPTVIEQGALAVTGSITGSSAIHVKAGAALDVTGLGAAFPLAAGQRLLGGGTVFGSVNMSEGSTLAPGDVAGVFNVSGNLNLTAAVTPAASEALKFELGLPEASDKVSFLGGVLSIGGGVLGFGDFAFSALPGFAEGTYTLFDTAVSIDGTLDETNLSGPIGSYFGTLGISGDGHDLVLTVVPEPGSATLLLAGLGTLIGMRRSRRRQE